MTEGSRRPLDDLLDQLKSRVEARRAAGDYPPDLEEQLAMHYRTIVDARAGLGAQALDNLRSRLESVRTVAHFDPRPAPLDSKVPGGKLVHRVAAPFVSRHADELRRQIGEYTEVLGFTLDDIVAVQEELLKAIERITELVAENQRVMRALRATELEVERRTAELAQHRDPVLFRPWFSPDAFEANFRGTREAVLDRYRDLAKRFEGCSPVLDLGCGRGEFLELLSELDLEASGVELDEELADDASARGLKVESAEGLTFLAGLPDSSLGGLVLLQVIEHLSPQQAVDFVPLAAEKVRPGGRVVVETVNPQSLFVFSHAFYLDPSHLRLVHPLYLDFLFREAGFAHVEIEWRSAPPSEELLIEVPGDDDATQTLNRDIRRLNDILFGPQDYALIATR